GAADPLMKMLPIKNARVVRPDTGFLLSLTAEGHRKPFLQMETEPQDNQRFWAEMPRHYWGVIGEPKPGATALAQAVEGDKGKDVKVVVRLSKEAGLLPEGATPAARIVRILPDGKEEKLALVPLAASEHQPSVLQGKIRDLPAGQYRIDLEIPEIQAKLSTP